MSGLSLVVVDSLVVAASLVVALGLLGAQALVVVVLGFSCPQACGMLVPGAGIEPMSSALVDS